MTDIFLGIIAVAVAIMALIQVGAILVAAKAARRVSRIAGDLEREVRPIVANLQAMSADAARATSRAAEQVEKANELLDSVSKRVDETVTTIQENIMRPARDGLAVIHGLRTAIAAFRDSGRSRRKADTHEDEELFIG